MKLIFQNNVKFSARCQLEYPKQFYSSYQKQKKIYFSFSEKPRNDWYLYQRERIEVKILLDYVQAFGQSTSLFMNAGAWDTAPLQNCEDLEHPAPRKEQTGNPHFQEREECPCHRKFFCFKY